MKQMLIDMLIACDAEKHGLKSCGGMCPSSSIDEIAEYISAKLGKDDDDE